MFQDITLVQDIQDFDTLAPEQQMAALREQEAALRKLVQELDAIDTPDNPAEVKDWLRIARRGVVFFMALNDAHRQTIRQSTH